MAEHGGIRPRLLIEDWLPAAAIGVECMRERGSASALAPTTFLHVWWARRPLAASRAAVLASVLPANFSRERFERLMGFGRSGDELVAIRQLMDTGVRVEGGFGAPRSFKAFLREDDVEAAHQASAELWGALPAIIDPMAGGGSIPLESSRLGFQTFANEYNPVACSVLEATLDYPVRHGPHLAGRAKHWGKIWETRVSDRLSRFFPKEVGKTVHAYIYARTVPCPSTGHMTPLVPDWHLKKPQAGHPVVAVPIVDKSAGTWTTEIRKVGDLAGLVTSPPPRTYVRGQGISLFTGETISSDWIKSQAQAGRMQSQLYVMALKTPRGLEFRPPRPEDLDAILAAELQLEQCRADWEARGVLPTEEYPLVASDARPRIYGMNRWADMFSPRQLLGFGVLVEELQGLRADVLAGEGEDLGEAVLHLLAFALDKFANWNAILSSWNVRAETVRSVFDRHDFSFKPSFSEMAPVSASSGLAWVIGNVIDAYEAIAALPNASVRRPITITNGSATSLVELGDGSIDAVVVDPPYSDNVQYSELADFFYVWLKRLQGHRRPDWFSSYLCDNTLEAVKNDARHRTSEKSAKSAATAAQEQYQRLMTEVFRESRRVLRPEGALTVMFTHKRQEAWEALFQSLIEAGFTITATWPVKTESEHSLHQAKKNAAQSTVILVSRVRPDRAGIGYFDASMRQEIEKVARRTAERLEAEGLNPVDQLVGSFGPAMEVFSQYDQVVTDTGEPVAVGQAIDIAADAVAKWRISQLASDGLAGVEPEAQFALLCWATLGAAEFRFNEAKLLGHAVGMDVSTLQQAGLISVSADKVRILSAKERRRGEPLSQDEAQQMLFGLESAPSRRVRRADALKVHPRDPAFRTNLDKAHALALVYAEGGGGTTAVGAARSYAKQQGLKPGDPTVRLIEALLNAAPQALRKGGSAIAEQFAEFRVWHALLEPLFGINPPDWSEEPVDRDLLDLLAQSAVATDEAPDVDQEEEDIAEDEEDA
jgi:putative DNA methylase